MSVLAVGLSHRTAPVSVLESAALAGERLDAFVRDVRHARYVAEGVVVSTCNRVEVYAEVDKFHGGVAEVSELLSAHSGLTLDALTPHLYVLYEDRAVQHLFSVACGLDSMVVGESQVLGQVRAALRRSQELDTTGRVLNELFQQALRVGKRAHAETDIDRAGASLVSVGLAQVDRVVGDLAGRSALVIGAGSMSALAATSLARSGAGEVAVVNRTYDNAVRLAKTMGGRAVPLTELVDAIAAADVVVSCTGAVGHVVTRDQVEQARARRGSAPQYVLDLALPRDVDPSVADLDGVAVCDLAALQDVLAGEDRDAEEDAVRAIVTEEVAAYLSWQQAVQVAPTVVALRTMASDVVDAELGRLAGRIPDLEQRDRDEIELTVRRVVDKLLHAPTVRVKQLAEEPGGHAYAEALRELFGLDPKAIEAMTRADAAVEEAGP
ncbi:MAG: glutamyl-tRNA reductase [Actinomycetes bacterium]